MIKIRNISILFGILILLMAPFALGANEDGKVTSTNGKLLITDVDVKVGSKSDKNLDYGDKIKNEAKPGDKVEFSIEVKNNFTDAQDLEIEDIELTVTIEGIDDDDDLDEDAKEFDVKADDDDKVKIEFEIPLEVDEDTFDVLIEVEGDDENGTTHKVEYALDLEVEKEDNEVQFTRNTITPSEIKCSRTVQLSTAVLNTGADDEDGVVLEVLNSALGVSFKETFDLSNDAFDDDSKFRKTFTFSVPTDVSPGIYSIISEVIFNDGSDTEEETADLVVTDCEALKEAEEEEDVVVVAPPVVTVPTTPTDVVAESVTTPTLPTTEEKSVFRSTGFLATLIVGEILLVIIAVVIIVMVVRRKREE
ncbi:hypothetical protein CL615_02505 [archaeon]|nr:hypothetical protein [archaeon]